MIAYSKRKLMKPIVKVIKDTFAGFMQDKGLKLSASLSYYTVFSLAPLLLLIISLTGLFFGKEAVEGKVFAEINGLIGSEAASQIQNIIQNLELSGKTNISMIIGAVTLVIGATTVFNEIQDSINMIWKLKAKPKKGWLKLIKNRLLSGSVIIGLGFLLIVSLLVNGVLLALSDTIRAYFPQIAVILVNSVDILINFGVITVL